MPPVDVPAARLPAWSNATAPTVPNLWSPVTGSTPGLSDEGCPGTGAARSFSSARWRLCHRSSVKKYFASTSSTPWAFAKDSAPSPIIITCGDFSITLRASSMGFFTWRRPATEPAARVVPSMMAASSSLMPSWLKTAPLPALKWGESSRMRMAAVTASRLLPFWASTAWPALSACWSTARTWASRSGETFAREMTTAPPWMTIPQRGLRAADVLVQPRGMRSSAVPATRPRGREGSEANIRRPPAATGTPGVCGLGTRVPRKGVGSVARRPGRHNDGSSPALLATSKLGAEGSPACLIPRARPLYRAQSRERSGTGARDEEAEGVAGGGAGDERLRAGGADAASQEAGATGRGGDDCVAPARPHPRHEPHAPRQEGPRGRGAEGREGGGLRRGAPARRPHQPGHAAAERARQGLRPRRGLAQPAHGHHLSRAVAAHLRGAHRGPHPHLLAGHPRRREELRRAVA